MFVVTLTHTPELCFGNESYKELGRKWVENMKRSARELQIKIHGAYISPNEHTFYFIIESDNFRAISDFLEPPMLTHHTARISPVLDIEEGFGLDFMKSSQGREMLKY